MIAIIINASFAILHFLSAILPITATCALVILFIYTTYYAVKKHVLKRVKYNREFSVSGVFEGEEVTLTETVYNSSILPVFFVDFESYIYHSLKIQGYAAEDNSAMQLIISRFHLMPYMQITRRHKITCTRRGYYKLSTVCVITKKWGIEEAEYFSSETELYVYPKSVELNQISYPVNYVQGDSISMRRIMQDPFSISGIRDYSSGDPFNMINFKATAKSGFQGMQSIKVNKLDYCSNRIFMIYINFQISMAVPTEIYESLMEQALSFAASFISEALRNGYRVGLSANCQMVSGEKLITFPIIGGLHHIEDILREMAKIQIRSGVSFASLLNRGIASDIYDAEIFIITLDMNASIDDSISLMKRRNNAVTVVEPKTAEYTKYLSSIGKHSERRVSV